MNSEEIDLRKTATTCNSHPILQLKSSLESLSERSVEEVRVIFSEKDIPVNILRFILAKYGYIVHEISRLNSESFLLIAKRKTEK